MKLSIVSGPGGNRCGQPWPEQRNDVLSMDPIGGFGLKQFKV
jgi:hypothetical protein